MINVVSDAYSRRAEEYAELFGSMSAVHPSDRQLVATWADSIEGQVIDAGCGPGQWTNFLSELGLPACGVDLVPEFIERARLAHPGIPFRVESLNALNVETGTVGGEYLKLQDWITTFVNEPSTMPWGNRSLLFRDPDGNLVNIFTPVTAAAIEKFATYAR
jgi:SAM-dependent methyltransferase